ncbi:MAG TPA: chorismate mutase [Blastocatellia bacterium]|nr:chorismate mutase [Blastocatellia bacterium]
MSGDINEQAKQEMSGWRQRIDEIDLQLVKLFNERTQCAIEIGHIKKRLGLEIYSPSREAQVIANVTNANTGPLDAEAIRRLFERVIDEARRIERIHASNQEEGGN